MISDGKTLRRIHIIGGPGSGKTILAGQLGDLLGVTPYDLDVIGYEGGAGAKRPLDLRLADVHSIVTQTTWVTDGIFLWWTDELLKAADVIIWLDIPWRVATWRIVTRNLRATLAGTNPHPGFRKLMRLLWWNKKYYTANTPVKQTSPDDDDAINRASTAKGLAPYANKTVQCRHPSDVETFLISVSQVS